jgi:leader peptidase (prepilin peptidase)/N-methyltransferase
MDIIQIFELYPTLYIISVGLFGLLVGSFLNVVVYRLPIMMEKGWQNECAEAFDCTPPAQNEPFNLALPASHCPHCQHEITAVENIPLLSYMVQKGRCKGCKKSISLRYPLVELSSAVLVMMVAMQLGVGWSALAAIILTWGLLTLSLIDFDTQYLFDNLTMPLLWLGIICNMFGLFTDLQSSVLGAIVGYLSLWSVSWISKLIRGKEGMGAGDFKLLAMLGAWLGVLSLPLIIFLSSLVGAVVGISMVLFLKQDSQKRIPFGPYLAMAGWISLLWGQDIMGWYLG